jgi:hypothetical protein
MAKKKETDNSPTFVINGENGERELNKVIFTVNRIK